ncbi:hypothetical protein C8F04DRAFT_1179081 [Mycena alexandri]|uniref:Bromo domain-containing protein n=1 Tax=Mycena alexandri TaxID=1745969 RepID=A0AAD6X8S9_9AGAR|nr:hypothetical protein C8F04DRAFT_1179081 [Mycena alexandri]
MQFQFLTRRVLTFPPAVGPEVWFSKVATGKQDVLEQYSSKAEVFLPLTFHRCVVGTKPLCSRRHVNLVFICETFLRQLTTPSGFLDHLQLNTMKLQHASATPRLWTRSGWGSLQNEFHRASGLQKSGTLSPNKVIALLTWGVPFKAISSLELNACERFNDLLIIVPESRAWSYHQKLRSLCLNHAPTCCCSACNRTYLPKVKLSKRKLKLTVQCLLPWFPAVHVASSTASSTPTGPGTVAASPTNPRSFEECLSAPPPLNGRFEDRAPLPLSSPPSSTSRDRSAHDVRVYYQGPPDSLQDQVVAHDYRIIARTEEGELYHEMDVKREREALERWRAQGHRGKPPPGLTQLEELTECYQKDEPFEAAIIDETAEGRGQRRRNVVSYNDGLSDEAWAMALEDGEDLEELADRSRKQRGTNKLLRDAEASGRGTPVSDSDSRARKGKKGKSRMSAPDYEPSLGSKRERGVKSMSVTPSVNEDDDEDRQPKRRKAPPKSNGNDVPPAVREKMKVFAECYRAVVACEDTDGRKRCELFRELPDRHDYPDYFQLITQPIALSRLRKRGQGNYYKDMQQYRNDWTLMFNNARTYNQEGSWVYIDAVEMEKVLNATFKRLTAGSGLPGAMGGAAGGSSGSYESALTPMDEDDRPPPSEERAQKCLSLCIIMVSKIHRLFCLPLMQHRFVLSFGLQSFDAD